MSIQNWVKKGLIYKPDGNLSWSKSHAQVPVVDKVDDKIWRIYFSTRDDQNRSRTAMIEVEAGNPQNVLSVSKNPILDIGKPGLFDDCGAMPSWIVNVGDKKYLYYIGWTVRNTVPYHNSIGLAVSSDQGRTFQKFSEGPLFSPTIIEPYFTGTSCVLKDDDGVWKNWYLSCTGWKEVAGKYEPLYDIKYATSKDGIHWNRNGTVAIGYKNDKEGGLVKASVVKEDNLYKMWYAYRNAEDYRTNADNSYRIGYAQSRDGISWERKDDTVNLGLSEEGFDTQMLCYPHVIEHKGKKFMFYNGDGFGASGIGYAVWEDKQ